MLKVGILGMGMMGWFHATRYLQRSNVVLTAIADLNPERLQANAAVQGNIANRSTTFDFSKVKRYPEASRLIAEADVDIIDICLPTYLHAQFAIEALAAGRHVLCEKPMALNVTDANRMIEAAYQADRLLMIAQCLRFWPEYCFLQAQISTQKFGKLRSLNMTRIGGKPGWGQQNNWYLDPQRSGGAILDLHIHDVDFVNALFGMPDHISATTRQSPETGAYDIVHACYDYEQGPQVHIHGGWSTAQIPFQASFDAWFDRGFIRFNSAANPTLQIYDDLTSIKPHPANYKPGDAYLNEIAYFVDCVENDTMPEACPPESARDSVALVFKEIAAANT